MQVRSSSKQYFISSLHTSHDDYQYIIVSCCTCKPKCISCANTGEIRMCYVMEADSFPSKVVHYSEQCLLCTKRTSNNMHMHMHAVICITHHQDHQQNAMMWGWVWVISNDWLKFKWPASYHMQSSGSWVPETAGTYWASLWVMDLSLRFPVGTMDNPCIVHHRVSRLCT